MQTITIDEASASLRRILFVAELPADRNEVQYVNLGDISTSDTFTLTYDGQTTGAISYDATPATLAGNIDTALEALSNIGASEVAVAQVTGNVYSVTFSGALAATDLPLLSIGSPTTFTPGTVTQYQHGGVAGAPARAVTFGAADIQVSKNGAAYTNSTGTVTELGHGAYYYEAASGEVGTQGFLSLACVRTDVAVIFPTAQIVPASGSVLGAPVVRSGTAQAGAAGSITLDASASAVSAFYLGNTVYLRSGTGAGQARSIYAYNGTTKVASVEPNWAVNPDNTTVFDVIPAPTNMADMTIANHDVPGTFGGDIVSPQDVATATKAAILDDDTAFSGADIAAIEGRLPAALVGGRMASEVESIATSTTAAVQLAAHANAVLRFLLTTGSTTTAINLDVTTGIDGAVPTTSNNAFVGKLLVFSTGALRGQAKTITAYNGTTKVITVGDPFTASPASGDTGVIV